MQENHMPKLENKGSNQARKGKEKTPSDEPMVSI
jgi:hypothetical protein